MPEISSFVKRIKDALKHPSVLYTGERIAYVLLLITVFLLIFISFLPEPFVLKYQKSGEVSNSFQKAEKPFWIIEEEATEANIKAGEEQLFPIYTLNLEVLPPVLEKVNSLFSKIEKIQTSRKSDTEKLSQIKRELAGSLKKEDVDLLFELKGEDLMSLEEDTKRMISICFGKGIYNDKRRAILEDLKKGIKIEQRSERMGKEERVVHNIEEIYLFSQIKARTAKELNLSLPPFLPLSEFSWKIAKNYLEPNLKFNEKATLRERERLKSEIAPVKIFVQRGQKIVGEGELIDRITERKLAAMAEIKKEANIKVIVGFFITLLLCLAGFAFYLLTYQKELLTNKRKLLTLLLIMVVMIGSTRLLLNYAQEWAIYLFPFTASSILIAFLLSGRLAIFFTFITSLLIGIMLSWNLEMVIFFFLSGLFAIFIIPFVRTRGEIAKIGLTVALINAAILLAFQLIYQEPIALTLRSKLLLGILNGIIVYWVVIGALHLFENYFFLTTNFKLFELSDLNTPLLRDLFLEAPGTYHHSLLVGNLAESSASLVGANPLLARVSSYYHDVGKIINPQYFTENQRDKNIHPEIKPTLSATVLRSHIQRGVDIAKAKKMPLEIVEIIRQHHGTSVMTYFYHQAREKDQEPNVEEYRYSGPKPETKEAGIIMLADSVETASRTLEKPSPARIEHLVKQLIKEKFVSGELDECDLTLKDLTKISGSFVHILTSLFHARVEYPREELLKSK
ncbi:HDIG domain-containing protein [bacterium]|nr:HDIG domain-containing protein [bacterium]